MAKLTWGMPGLRYGDPRLLWGGNVPETWNDPMSALRREYGFADSVLIENAVLLLAAGTAYPAILTRLPTNYLTETETMRASLVAKLATQTDETVDLAGHTTTQDEALAQLNSLIGAARTTARMAFRGQTTKLAEAFCVGDTTGKSLPAVVARARTIAASCANADNVDAMTASGWLPADTTALNNAIAAVTGADVVQEEQKGTKKGGTADVNLVANELYRRMRKIQNAADLQWPEGVPAHIPMRDAFRLGIFPPETKHKPKTTPDPTPTPPPNP